VIFIKANFKIIKQMVLGNIIIKMEEFMQDIGIIIYKKILA